MNRDILVNNGIDYDEGCERFLGIINVYDSLLERFAEENAFAQAEEAYRTGDRTHLYSLVHALKGVAGNLSINGVYNLCTDICDRIKNDPDANIELQFARLRVENSRAIKGIRSAG